MARKNLLKNFKRPRDIKFETLEEKRQEYGKFAIAPFERGYGYTIGNTLRRILLSSIQGYAVTAVRITTHEKNKEHVISNEFEQIPGVSEDTVELISNLKKVVFTASSEIERETISVEVKGPGALQGKDLEFSEFSVINKDFVICRLMDDASFNLELEVDLGRNYVPAEENSKYIDIIGTLPVDALYSPVKRVSLSVEDTRVGDKTDYDKLILEIWTDQSISPATALGEAAKIAKEHFTLFINFDENEIIQNDDETEEEDEAVKMLLSTSIDDLELSVRSNNCLKSASIRTLGELINKTEADLSKTKNFGKKSLDEIIGKLKERNLRLGINDLKELKEIVRTKGTGEPENDQ